MSRLEAAVAARIAGGTVHSDLDGAQEVAWDAIQDADLSGFVVRIEQAAECLGLDDVSVAVLWFGTAVELDWRLGDVIGFLLGEQGRRRPTVRLTAELLADEELEPATVFACLGADAPLRRHGALCLEGSDAQRPLADQPIEPAPELIAFLRETSLLGAGSDSRLSRREVPDHPVGRPRTLERIRSALHTRSDAALLVSGSDGAEMLALAGARGLLLVDARAAGDGELLGRARLIAALENRELAFGYAERLDSDELGALVERFESSGEPLTLWATSPVSELPAIVVEVPMPTLAERREAWAALAGPSIANEVAAKFRLSTVQIARAARIARVEAEMAGRDTPSADDLDAGARRASRSALANRAVRLVSDRAWTDLVLPQRQLEQLHGISAYLRHRDQVLTEWGFERAVSGR